MDDSLTDSAVDLQKVGGVAILRLNRPHRLNAFTPKMRDGIIAALDDCDLDDGVRAVVITGAGRAFCAGADLAAGAASFVRGTGRQVMRRRTTGVKSPSASSDRTSQWLPQ